MRSILFLLLLIIVLDNSCMNSKVPPQAFFFHITYKNSSGADLLNPSTIGYYNSVHVSDLVMKNGALIEAPARIDLDSCSNYVCQSKSGEYYIHFIPESSYKGTLIHLGVSEIDTLTYVTMPMGSGIGINQVLHRGKQIWTNPKNAPPVVVLNLNR